MARDGAATIIERLSGLTGVPFRWSDRTPVCRLIRRMFALDDQLMFQYQIIVARSELIEGNPGFASNPAVLLVDQNARLAAFAECHKFDCPVG